MAQSSKREICATNTSLLPYLNPIFLQILYATRSTEQNYTSSRPTLSSNESPNTNNDGIGIWDIESVTIEATSETQILAIEVAM